MHEVTQLYFYRAFGLLFFPLRMMGVSVVWLQPIVLPCGFRRKSEWYNSRKVVCLPN